MARTSAATSRRRRCNRQKLLRCVRLLELKGSKPARCNRSPVLNHFCALRSHLPPTWGRLPGSKSDLRPHQVIYPALWDVYRGQADVYHPHWVVYNPHRDVYRGQTGVYDPQPDVYRAQKAIYTPQKVILHSVYQLYSMRGLAIVAQ